MLKFYCKMWARLRLTLITCWLKILHMILFAATMTPFLKKWRKNTWVKSRGNDLFFEATQISKISIWTADRVYWCVSIGVYVYNTFWLLEQCLWLLLIFPASLKCTLNCSYFLEIKRESFEKGEITKTFTVGLHICRALVEFYEFTSYTALPIFSNVVESWGISMKNLGFCSVFNTYLSLWVFGSIFLVQIPFAQKQGIGITAWKILGDRR